MKFFKPLMEKVKEVASALVRTRLEEVRQRALLKYETDQDAEFSLSEARVLMNELGLTMYAIKTPTILYRKGSSELQSDMICPKEGYVKNVDLMDLGPRSYFKVFWKAGFNFGWAVEAAKNGHLITRAGWNGKGMFVFVRPADVLSEKFVVETVKSLPAELKRYYRENPISPDQAGDIYFRSYFCMKGADGMIVNGWLASQTDMLAEDWNLFTW